MSKIRLIGGYMDTRTNNEDFAITPYLFSVWVTVNLSKIRGLGICWGFWSVYLGIGINVPNSIKSFVIYRKP